MNDTLPCFTLTDSARQYLLRGLSIERSAQGLVTSLMYCGCLAPEKDGKVLWTYHGPNFLIAGQRPAHLRAGAYYDLLGFQVWIGEVEQILLKGKSLTTIHYGTPQPQELLVIDGAPADYFDTMGKCQSRVSPP